MNSRMRSTLGLCLLLVTAAWHPSRGRPTTPADDLTLLSESTLWFEGSSTLRDWSCKATAMSAHIEARDGATAAVIAGNKAVRAVEFTVPAGTLECGNAIMNEHMMKALDGDTYPTITFTLQDYTLTPGTPLTGTLRGTLLLRGQTKPVAIPAEFKAAPGGALRVTGAYPLRMTDWSVKPPTLMMGSIKVGPLVTVKFSLLLK
ncbi:MAG: YceI family protein [Gemmatimonadaceae bacterium]